MSVATDIFDRQLRDLRISVTDRCNFRCTYCMPKEVFGPGYEFLPRDQLLTFEEIASVARHFAARGVKKVRITGGEPLLRKNIEALIALLSEVDGISDLTLTTNASLLARKAEGLAAAGLDRVTVSLDAMDDPTFQAMNDVGFPVSTVLEAIEVASGAGLGPIKVNAVIKRGVNEHAVLDMARHFRGTGHIVRFIEYMDVGNSNGWRQTRSWRRSTGSIPWKRYSPIIPARSQTDSDMSTVPARWV
jgi:cyclic pyranopterin phosphate synthase